MASYVDETNSCAPALGCWERAACGCHDAKIRSPSHATLEQCGCTGEESGRAAVLFAHGNGGEENMGGRLQRCLCTRPGGREMGTDSPDSWPYRPDCSGGS